MADHYWDALESLDRITAERDELRAEVDRLTAELDDVRADLDRVIRSRDAARAELRRLESWPSPPPP